MHASLKPGLFLFFIFVIILINPIIVNAGVTGLVCNNQWQWSPGNPYDTEYQNGWQCNSWYNCDLVDKCDCANMWCPSPFTTTLRNSGDWCFPAIYDHSYVCTGQPGSCYPAGRLAYSCTVPPPCTPTVPDTEVCDGVDNDCDGNIDNGPSEVCDGIDNDCDKLIDFKRTKIAEWTSGENVPYGLAITPSGKKIIAFQETNTSATCNADTNFLLQMFDSNNSLLSTKEWGTAGTYEDNLYAITTDGSENIYVAGVKQTTLSTCPTLNGNFNSYLAKFSISGNSISATPIWETQRDLFSGFNEKFTSVFVKGNYVYATGATSISSKNDDIYYSKYNKDTGGLICTGHSPSVSNHEQSKSIIVDDSGNVYVFASYGISSENITIKKFNSSCVYLKDANFPNYEMRESTSNEVFSEDNLLFLMSDYYLKETKLVSIASDFSTSQTKIFSNIKSSSVITSPDGILYSFGRAGSLIQINPFNINQSSILYYRNIKNSIAGDNVSGATYFDNNFFITFLNLDAAGVIQGGSFYTYTPLCSLLALIPEICDGIDNDGDGLIDENDVCVCYKEEAPNGNVYPLPQILGASPTNLLDYNNFNNKTGTGIFGNALDVALSGPIYVGDKYYKLNPGTISFWMKPSHTINSSNPGGRPWGERNRFELRLEQYNAEAYDGKMYLDFGENGVKGLDSITSSWNANQWYHVAITWGVSGSACIKKLWINGVLEDTVSQAVNLCETSSTEQTNQNFCIGSTGRDLGGCRTPSNFHGTIDEFVVFNRALSDCEIKKLALGPSACLNDCESGSCSFYDVNSVAFNKKNFSIANVVGDKNEYTINFGETKIISDMNIKWDDDGKDCRGFFYFYDNNTLTKYVNGSNPSEIAGDEGIDVQTSPQLKINLDLNYILADRVVIGIEKHENTCLQVNFVDLNFFFPQTCTPYCKGIIYPYSSLVLGDDQGLLQITDRNLVETNTTAKCEYICAPGYAKQGNSCVLETSLNCTGALVNHSHLVSLDENIGLTILDNRALLLVDLNSDRRCELICDPTYHREGQTCIFGITDINGVCGDRNTSYLASEINWPIDSFYCFSGNPSPSVSFPAKGYVVSWQCLGSGVGTTKDCSATRGFNYDNCAAGDNPPFSSDGITIGPIDYYSFDYSPKEWTFVSSIQADMNCKWMCNDGYTRIGAGCVSTGAAADVNNLDLLAVKSAKLINGKIKLEVTTRCSNNVQSLDFNVFDELNNPVDFNVESMSGSPLVNGSLDCNNVDAFVYLDFDELQLYKKYRLVAQIQPTCNICKREAFFNYTEQSDASIPDNNIALSLVVLVFVSFIALRKRI